MRESVRGGVSAAEAMSEAARRGDLEGVRKLLADGLSPDAKDADGYTPLIHAAARGHRSVAELLLAEGADPFILDSCVYSSALHRAAQSTDPGIAVLLIRHGAPIDLQSPLNGHTALIDAAWHKRADVVAALLDAGADLDLRGRLGYTALDVARRDGIEEIAALIEARASRIRETVDEQRLMAAAEAGDAVAVIAELEAGGDVNALSPSGFTPLMVASQNGDAAIVRLLLAAGASARIVDPLMKATPGHKAGYRGHADVARVLLEESDLEVDAQGPYNGYTALHDAVWHGHAEAARAFVEGGARLDVEGLDGRTPLDIAVQYGYEEIAAMLRGVGAGGDGRG